MTSDLLINETYSQLDAACDVQRGFMEHEAPAIDSLSYSARCRQVYELGGDCYDFVQLPDNRLAVAVGDASGKGVAAALMISNVQSSLRTAALCSKNDLAGILRLVNRQVRDLTFGPIRDIVLWSFRSRDSDPAVCERWAQPSPSDPAGRFDRLAGSWWPARRNFSRFHLRARFDPTGCRRCGSRLHGRGCRGAKSERRGVAGGKTPPGCDRERGRRRR